MKAIKLSVNVFVLMALVVALTALPATAQSRWDFEPSPAVFGLGANGLLVTIAPPTFTGCTEDHFEWGEILTDWPDVVPFSFFFVWDDGIPVWTSRWVSTASGRGNWLFESDTWLRVFPVQSADLDSFYENPCAFYGSHTYIAEGLGHISMHSPDDLLEGPGTNPWGWAITGNLNENEYCPDGGTAHLHWVHNWITHSTDNLKTKTTADKGPTLTCK